MWDLAQATAGGGLGRRLPQGIRTVLLVDDEAAIVDLVRDVLTLDGYSVLAAHSPGEAQALARSYDGPIDLLLTDVVMPEMNGKDLCAQIVSERPAIRTVFMSGNAAGILDEDGTLQDGACFIQKPFTLSALAASVRDALDGANGGGTRR